MVASLVRLLHSGIQDERLVTNDFGCYVSVLVRAGRMTTQWSRLDFQQTPGFGQTAVCRLLKKGELITRLYLVANMPDIYTLQAKAAGVGPNFGWTNSLGHALVAHANITIGGSLVETIDARLLEVMDEYNTPLEKVINVNKMIGRVQNGFNEKSLGNSVTPTQVIVPLPFWFSRGDLGAALPIDAINVDDIRLSIQFRPVNSLYYTESRSVTAAVPTTEGSSLWPILGSVFYKADPNGKVVPGLSYTGPVSVVPDVQMPISLALGDTYLLAEYVYLDRPEANRFRLADIEIPIVQHVPIDVKDTRRAAFYQIPFEIQNPIRHLYFMAQNYNAATYNAFFVAAANLRPDGKGVIWPDCEGLNGDYYSFLKPGYLTSGNEPFNLIELVYEGSYIRTSTENCAMYRSILPSLEERKTPWINRYMYCIPFGMQSGYTDPSVVMGEANMNRINKKELRLGIVGSQQIWIYMWAETYNVLKIYGGRAALLFAY